MSKYVSLQQEVLLCLHLSVWTELTQPFLSGQLGHSLGQAVVAESVHSQCFPQFQVSYRAQILCHGVLSV